MLRRCESLGWALSTAAGATWICCCCCCFWLINAFKWTLSSSDGGRSVVADRTRLANGDEMLATLAFFKLGAVGTGCPVSNEEDRSLSCSSIGRCSEWDRARIMGFPPPSAEPDLDNGTSFDTGEFIKLRGGGAPGTSLPLLWLAMNSWLLLNWSGGGMSLTMLGLAGETSPNWPCIYVVVAGVVVVVVVLIVVVVVVVVAAAAAVFNVVVLLLLLLWLAMGDSAVGFTRWGVSMDSGWAWLGMLRLSAAFCSAVINMRTRGSDSGFRVYGCGALIVASAVVVVVVAFGSTCRFTVACWLLLMV